MIVGAIAPFRIDVPDSVLQDLRERLARTRWPIAPAGPEWAHGTSLAWMQKVVAYWQDHYDWRAAEARLNRHSPLRVELDGIGIHVLVERGSWPDPLPLILTHGWPGSVVEFLNMIEPLAHPERFGGDVADAFTVVVPSLPGYGFSDAPPVPISPRQVAAMWHSLMVDALGFPRYAAHGTDWGSVVGSWLALDHPQPLVGVHLCNATFRPAWTFEAKPLDAQEQDFLKRFAARREGETAYQIVHGTKPQTLAYATTDSPAGLAAWILEKFHGWTVGGQDVAPAFDLDHLLTNVMLYWIAGPNAASWMYRYLVDMSAFVLPAGQRVEVPTGFCLFPDDIAVVPPDRWLARSYNVVHRTLARSGGHFPGLEQPGFLVDDLRAFARGRRHA